MENQKENKTIHFSAVNKYGEYLNMPTHITNSSDARHWVINHLDLSEDWTICRGEIRPKGKIPHYKITSPSGFEVGLFIDYMEAIESDLNNGTNKIVKTYDY